MAAWGRRLGAFHVGALASLVGCAVSHPPPTDAPTAPSDAPVAATDAPTAPSDVPVARADAPGLFARCVLPRDCVAIESMCCWGSDRDHWIAVAREHVGDWYDEACTVLSPPRGVACTAPCFFAAEHPVATCVAGECRLVDPRAAPWTECSADSDCIVRSRDCASCYVDGAWCEWPADYGVPIAGDREADFVLEVCGEGAVVPSCPVEPAAVYCDAGRCAFVPRP